MRTLPEQADAAERDRYVFVERPRCPICNSAKLRTVRTERHGDESVTRHTRCCDCRAKFFVVVE
jgi:DNA-directed RNA polymerase subunit M/transcription elongation factor TFIIS